MNIIGAFDRSQISDLVPREGRSVLITITSPNNDFAELHKNWSDVLRLKFDDATNGDGKGKVLISEEQAFLILNFCIRNLDKDFFVNCDAGISRSTAVVVALELIFNSRDISNEYRYQYHNKYVKNVIKDAWFKKLWWG